MSVCVYRPFLYGGKLSDIWSYFGNLFMGSSVFYCVTLMLCMNLLSGVTQWEILRSVETMCVLIRTGSILNIHVMIANDILHEYCDETIALFIWNLKVSVSLVSQSFSWVGAWRISSVHFSVSVKIVNYIYIFQKKIYEIFFLFFK